MKKSMFVLMLLATGAFAQVEVTFGPFGGPPVDENKPRQPGHRGCCVPVVYDAAGKALGEVIKYDERFQSVPLNAWVRYELKGGDGVALNVGADGVFSPIGPGGSNIVFTSNDCSGDAFVTALSSPPLTKRYGVILTVGGVNPGPWAATNAWLYVTDPLPSRTNAGATVFHSQWDMSNACTPYPAPGLTFNPGTWGFTMHKLEDLYAKYKRPFYIP